MNLKSIKFGLEQLVFLAGLFLLLNLIFFVPDYYSLQFNTQICDNVNNPEFDTENLPRSAEYYTDACGSVLKAWQHTLTPPITLRYHIIPGAIALILTAFYTYYRKLDIEYRKRGWKDEPGP